MTEETLTNVSSEELFRLQYNILYYVESQLTSDEHVTSILRNENKPNSKPNIKQARKKGYFIYICIYIYIEGGRRHKLVQ
jgi:hypothetical protein